MRKKINIRRVIHEISVSFVLEVTSLYSASSFLSLVSASVSSQFPSYVTFTDHTLLFTANIPVFFRIHFIKYTTLLKSSDCHLRRDLLPWSWYTGTVVLRWALLSPWCQNILPYQEPFGIVVPTDPLMAYSLECVIMESSLQVMTSELVFVTWITDLASWVKLHCLQHKHFSFSQQYSWSPLFQTTCDMSPPH
jgi:hypothetical protein